MDLAEAIDIHDLEAPLLQRCEQAIQFTRQIFCRGWCLLACILDGRLHVNGRPLIDFPFRISLTLYRTIGRNGDDTAICNASDIRISRCLIDERMARDAHIFLDSIRYPRRMYRLQQRIGKHGPRRAEKRRRKRRANRDDLLRPADLFELLIL